MQEVCITLQYRNGEGGGGDSLFMFGQVKRDSLASFCE